MSTPIWITGSLSRSDQDETRDRTEFAHQFNDAIDEIRLGIINCADFLDSPNTFTDSKFRIGRKDLYQYLFDMICIYDTHSSDFLSDYKIIPQFEVKGMNTNYSVMVQNSPDGKYIYSIVNNHYDFDGKVALTTLIYMTREGAVLEIEGSEDEHYAIICKNGDTKIKRWEQIQLEASISAINQFKEACAGVSRNIPSIEAEINTRSIFPASKIRLGRENLAQDLSILFQLMNMNKGKLHTEDRDIIIRSFKKLTSLDIDMVVNKGEFRPPTAQITIYDSSGKPVYLVTPYLQDDKILLEIESYIDAEVKTFEFPRD